MQAVRYGDALDEIDAARQVFGAAAWFDEFEAASASETGQIARADRAFRIAGDTPGVNAARARHALRAGRFDEAARVAEQAVAYPEGKAAWPYLAAAWRLLRSEEPTSELQSLMRSSYAVFCLKKKTTYTHTY